MKTYSIGRDINCDIVINDQTDVISRRHALLNVTSSGKMTIIDQSSHGTYVNGIRISQNTPFPVTRKDAISLAHVVNLDWSMIPRTNASMRYAILVFVGLLVIVGVSFGVKAITDANYGDNATGSFPVVLDSVSLKTEQERIDSLVKTAIADSLYQDSIKQVAKERQDSMRQDSIKKAHKRSIKGNPKEKEKEKTDKPVKPKQDAG
jgi:hypothetical protein